MLSDRESNAKRRLARRDRVQCDRCALEFRVAAPEADDSVWIVCPDCGVRFWHRGNAASKGVAIQDPDEVQAHWAAGRNGSFLTF